MRSRNHHGFSLIEVVIVIAVVGLLAVLGYVAWNKFAQQDADTQTSTSQSATADDVPAAPAIEETSDLDEASATLDEIDIDSSDEAQLEREAESFS